VSRRAGVAVSRLCDGMKSMKLLSVLPSLGLVSLSLGLVWCAALAFAYGGLLSLSVLNYYLLLLR
jgi:hypothetical protein